jgi:hypothetical protein
MNTEVLYLLFKANKIFLTFRDGPWLKNVISILERLKGYSVIRHMCVNELQIVRDTTKSRAAAAAAAAAAAVAAGGGGSGNAGVRLFLHSYCGIFGVNYCRSVIKSIFVLYLTRSTQQVKNIRHKQHALLFEGHQQFA